MLENLDEQLAGTLGSIEAAIVEMAPHVWEALVLGAFIGGVTSLLRSLFLIVVVLGAALWLRPRIIKWHEAEVKRDGCGGNVSGASSVIGGVSLIPLAIGVVGLFDQMMWIGIINPEARAIILLLQRIG